uniref:RRM domain-containing protein n=1 Tax=Salix viminalis TaxID=40686 RepID=A0A6N2KX02_SALVM
MGHFVRTRPMRVGPASNKKAVVGQQYPKTSYQNSQTQNDSDPNNTTIFVGNLDSNVMDDNLKELFGQYGQLLHVKIPAGKRCGFVQFAERSSAEEALKNLNGVQLSGQNIRLSWGRNPSNKQAQPDANQYSVVDTTGMDNKDTKIMGMLQLLRTPTCTMEVILAMGTISRASSSK